MMEIDPDGKKNRKMHLFFQIYADDNSQGKMTRSFFI